MNRIYQNEKSREISFPLGGIGTGCIGLAGNGRFLDVEICNRPNKGSHGGFTHFAVKCEDGEQVLDARVLQSDLLPPYSGSHERPDHQGFGWGPDRASMSGMPHFQSSVFNGAFPLANLSFSEDGYPGKVSLLAFNPMIPGNSFDSSIPGAMFEIEITNTQNRTLTYTAAFAVNNYYANYYRHNSIHEHLTLCGKDALFLSGDAPKDGTEAGDLTFLCDGENTSYQQYWFRGNWFDNLSVWWSDFTTFGPLRNRVYQPARNDLHEASCDDVAALSSCARLKPGETGRFRFVLSWSNPLMNNHWIITSPAVTESQRADIRKMTWKNWYATQFASSKESCAYLYEHFDRLLDETRRFGNALHASSIPEAAMDAVASNLAVLKSPTCLRLTDGSFYAFEGCQPHFGSCEGTCTHVWSYTYALAFLFPDLERSARELEYRYSTDEHGNIGFRVQLPVGLPKTTFRACVDGQYGTIMRTYREFLISGDIEWLRELWPVIKKCIGYAWSEYNPDGWDLDRDGVMEGRQHHTLDMELFGPNAWLTGMYLGGLKAGARMAEILGDAAAAEEYSAIFEKGRITLNHTLYNGEYFQQNIDLEDASVLDRYAADTGRQEQSARAVYWNEEANELKYQIGEGCSIDQLLGQWHADLLQLGDIFSGDKVQSALSAIYRYNYIRDMRSFANPCRLYCLNDEHGLAICAYPKNRRRPKIPVPYAEETMHGFEYAAASHMLIRGLVKEGEACVKAVRDRYDGERRNPFNEMECGSNYARSLASYALLLAYSGFQYDMYRHSIGFRPLSGAEGTFFWSLGSSWGIVCFAHQEMMINILYGSLDARSVTTPYEIVRRVLLNEQAIDASSADGIVQLDPMIRLNAGDTLCLSVR